MPPLHEALRGARLSARLSEHLMASMVGIEDTRLQDLESGGTDPDPEELEAYAQVFGLGVRELAAGGARRAPLTHLFYRSMSEGGAEAMAELIATGAHRVLGEFLRSARDLAELEGLLRRPRPAALPAPPKHLTDLGDAPPHGADRLADWLRAELGLGLEPIRSMQDLLANRLGIRVLWVTADQLNPVIDGASTLSPRPTILVNLVEGPLCRWRTRMTLAHELCHLLCDHAAGDDRFTIFSPHVPREMRNRWRMFADFDRVERRAGAFAACFLAPAETVRRIVGERDVTSEEAITAVGQELGVGRTTAINRLQHIFGLSKQTRLQMESRGANHWPRWFSGERAPRAIGLRSGEIKQLALQAFADSRIDEVQVRAYLNLPLTEPLPEYPGLSEEQRAPLRRVEDTIRGIAQQHLQEEIVGAAGCAATTVRRVPQGFEVAVERWSEGADAPSIRCGTIVVSHGRTILDVQVDTTAPRSQQQSE
jgi:transcriptional regulator with XRE-family HTH domain